jgi:hypothetical protein
MTTEVEDAEQQVAASKQRFQESLRSAGEAGTRLAVEARKKVTPALLAAVVAGVVVVAGVALVASRSKRRARGRQAPQPSLTGELTRAAGTWLLRAVALRLAANIAARFRDPPTERTPVSFALQAPAT